MIERKSKPFSVTTSDGKTYEFSSGSEIYLWARKHRPSWVVDSDKGVDYDKWDGEGSCTKEELEKCYENSSLFPQNRNKKKVEVPQ